MRFKNIYLILCWLFSLNFSFGGISPDENALFKEANKAYMNREYEASLRKYEELARTVKPSSAIYYNMGNAYFQTKNLPKAILYYEKAKRISPNDRTIIANLATANAQLTEPIEPMKSATIVWLWREIRSWLSATSWAYLTIGMAWSVLFAFLTWYYTNKEQVKKISFGIGLGSLLLCWLPWLMAHQIQASASNHRLAIVIVPSSPLLHSPDPNSRTVREVVGGIKVFIQDQIGNYIKAELPNGEQGWLKKSEIEII